MTVHPDGDVRYSLVIPVYNEEAVLPVLLRRIDGLLNGCSTRPRKPSLSMTAASTAVRSSWKPRPRTIRATAISGCRGISATRSPSPAGMDAASGRCRHRHGCRPAGPARSRGRDDRAAGRKATRSSMRGACRAKARAHSNAASAALFYKLLGRIIVGRQFPPMSATSGSSTARCSRPSAPCRSTTASCAACSHGLDSRQTEVTFHRHAAGSPARPNIRS